MSRSIILAAAMLGVVTSSDAAFAQTKSCGKVDHAAALHARWIKREPAMSPPADLAMDEAVCTQRRLVTLVSRSLGAPVGYKAGLTSQASQQQFGVATPLLGVIFEKSLLPEGTELPAKFGARPLAEADLIVTVADVAVNNARTPQDVARSLSTLQAYIELPDLVVAEGQKLTGPIIVAIGVGARHGVVGYPIAMRSDAAFIGALASMQVTLIDGDGKELGRAPGAAILGHPLNAVIFIAEELKRRGSALKPGDRLSLGSFGRPLVPQAGQKLTARYEGLPSGPLSVSVSFR